ncbi:hypothetical protein RclHR1_00160001 [Rhizophagus clarus]|uniref:Uncharacterized protein n=1 Tax=Rhizophagus clarus TaxID=94130 RepID=A0A2Z6QI41_9GLOM|nr:hypothetical protein RclHR1_00160001 [Rhizophagus clarus]
MSKQNLLVSAFQAEFLLKILAELHISKSETLNIRAQTLFQRSRVTIFEGHLKVQTKPRLFEGLGRSISKAKLYLKSRAQADQNISKLVLPECHSKRKVEK